MGAPPFELQGRPRDKPITANARTKTANARPLNPFASNKRTAARASHTSSPFPRHLRNAQTVSRVPDLCIKSALARLLYLPLLSGAFLAYAQVWETDSLPAAFWWRDIGSAIGNLAD